MKTSMRLNWGRFGVLGVFFFFATLAQGAIERRIEKTFTVSEGGKLVMDVDRGSIHVKTHPGTTLRIEVARSAEGSAEKVERIFARHRVDFRQEGAKVEVRAEYQRVAGEWDGNLQVRYTITAPKKFNVELKSKAGAISVLDLEGRADVRSSAGSLKLREITGPVNAQTAAGGITVDACADQVQAETHAGSIKIHDVNGSVTAKTSGGSIDIEKAKGDVVARTSAGSISVIDVGGRIEASTAGGSVRARLARPPTEDCLLKTSAGSIQVTLPENAGVDLDAQTHAGQVSTDFPIERDPRAGKGKLKARLNGGGPRLVAHTSGGSVHINKK